MLTYAQKQEAVAALKDKFEKAKTIIVTDACGMDVMTMNGLRSQLHTDGQGEFEYKVVKNAILRRASEGLDAEALTPHFVGPTAIAISYGDPVGLAKVMTKYAEDHDHFEIKGGLLDGRAIDEKEIGTLATLPGLDELRGKIVGLLQAPAQKIAAVLAAPASQIARVTDARRAQLEESGG